METLIQDEKNPFYNTPKHLQNEAHTLSERVSEAAHGLSDEVTSRYGDIAEQLKMVSEKSVQLVKKYPFYSILGATAVGIVIGSMIRKKLI